MGEAHETQCRNLKDIGNKLNAIKLKKYKDEDIKQIFINLQEWLDSKEMEVHPLKAEIQEVLSENLDELMKRIKVEKFKPN